MMIGVGMICKSSEKKEKKNKEVEKKRRARSCKCGGEYLPGCFMKDWRVKVLMSAIDVVCCLNGPCSTGADTGA